MNEVLNWKHGEFSGSGEKGARLVSIQIALIIVDILFYQTDKRATYPNGNNLGEGKKKCSMLQVLKHVLQHVRRPTSLTQSEKLTLASLREKETDKRVRSRRAASCTDQNHSEMPFTLTSVGLHYLLSLSAILTPVELTFPGWYALYWIPGLLIFWLDLIWGTLGSRTLILRRLLQISTSLTMDWRGPTSTASL